MSTADQSVAGQLLRGFHGVESRGWRWTEPSFSVALAVPAAAAQRGGILSADFVLPPVLVEQHPAVTVSARAGGAETSTTLAGAGDHRLELALPATALAGAVLTADFAVEPPFVPGDGDRRTLGIVARRFELAPR